MAYRTEPATFNRIVGPRQAEELVSRLTQATLVRLNRITGQVEPRLAREWSASPDGLTWTFRLLENVTYSDGTPFTSADVVFSFQALYDAKVKSEIARSVMVAGQPLQVRALDNTTVVVVLPAPYGPGISLLDSVPILPRHKLKAALDAGTFREAWGVSASPADVVGLGPFVIKEYRPGERLEFSRNPRFWKKDDAGRPLPFLDAITLQFVPDQNAEVVRLQSGDVDLISNQVRFEDLAALQDLEKKGQVRLHTAGVSVAPDMLWFNLVPGAPAVRDRPWLQREELRLAINAAIDRRALVNTVFLGQATEVGGPITPGHGEWFDPSVATHAFDRTAAKRLLASIGLTDRTGDGLLDDARGTASFTLMTQKGHSVRERSAAMLQEQLRQVGLQVNVVPLEARSLTEKWGKGEYEAIYFAIEFDAFDPARHLEFWMSSGPFHFWNPGQAKPATAWEGQIDDVMRRQSTSMDGNERRRLLAEARRVLAEHQPVLYFAAPKVIIATSARVQGVTASVLSPNVLWNAETLSVTTSTSARR